MANVLSPAPKFKAFDNNGNPLNGGKLFTYAAGTTTKVVTYASSDLASPNADPVILDFRGEADFWTLPNVAYKFVLAPSNDTDPPTNPIWTVDNIVSAVLLTLYGGVDTGIANAYVLNFSAPFASYVNGIVIYWLPNQTNTGPSTLNVNGLGALPIVDQNGVALTAGQIIGNQIATVILIGGQWRLQSSALATGSFTATLTGMVAGTTGTVNYKISGGLCTLYTTGNIIGVSNTTGMSMTGIPVQCRPIVQRNVLCSDLTDNSIAVIGAVGVGTGGAAIFAPFAVSGIKIIPGFFVNVLNKGINTGWTITYPL